MAATRWLQMQLDCKNCQALTVSKMAAKRFATFDQHVRTGNDSPRFRAAAVCSYEVAIATRWARNPRWRCQTWMWVVLWTRMKIPWQNSVMKICSMWCKRHCKWIWRLQNRNDLLNNTAASFLFHKAVLMAKLSWLTLEMSTLHCSHANDVLRNETNMFEKYLKRVDPKDIGIHQSGMIKWGRSGYIPALILEISYPLYLLGDSPRPVIPYSFSRVTWHDSAVIRVYKV